MIQPAHCFRTWKLKPGSQYFCMYRVETGSAYKWFACVLQCITGKESASILALQCTFTWLLVAMRQTKILWTRLSGQNLSLGTACDCRSTLPLSQCIELFSYNMIATKYRLLTWLHCKSANIIVCIMQLQNTNGKCNMQKAIEYQCFWLEGSSGTVSVEKFMGTNFVLLWRLWIFAKFSGINFQGTRTDINTDCVGVAQMGELKKTIIWHEIFCSYNSTALK